MHRPRCVRRLSVLAMCSAATLFAAPPTRAFPAHFVRASTQLSSDLFATKSTDTTPIATPPASASDASSGTDGAGSTTTASASASADYGVIQASAGATSTLAGGDLRAVATVGVLGSFGDSFTFSAPEAEPTVTVRFTLALDGSLSASCVSACNVSATNQLVDLTHGGYPLFSGIHVVVDPSAPGGDVLPPQTAQYDASFPNPTTIQLMDTLSIGASANGDPTADVSAEFQSGARLYVDVLTTGGTYSTDSGVTYPAPEGQALELDAAASGALALLGCAESRRRSGAPPCGEGPRRALRRAKWSA